MAETKRVDRPLSPHLQIYRPMLTMMMSILHRITGVALYVGVRPAGLVADRRGVDEAYFNLVQGFFGHWFGRLVLFGFTWALIHHALGGLRHLLWDTGRGFDLRAGRTAGAANLAGSIVLTILLWVIGYGVMP